MGHTSVGRIGNMCHTWRIVAVGNLAMFVVALLPPLVGSAILQPKSASAGLSPNCAKHVQILVGS